MSWKLKFFTFFFILLLVGATYLFVKYLFTYEQRNIMQREVETITGQNLTVTIFGFNGNIIKRWVDVQKISSPKGERNYTFFYTKDNKYVQIPDSVWYVAEEE